MKIQSNKFIFAVFLIFAVFFLWQINIFYKNQSFKKAIAATVSHNYEFYTPERISEFNVDELLFYKLISQKLGKDLSPSVNIALEKHFEDPFKRFFDRSSYKRDLVLEKKLSININSLKGQKIDGIDTYEYYRKSGNFYKSAELSNFPILMTWNGVVLKSLYCDLTGYDGEDFSYLKAMETQDGSSMDTHMLLSLLFLEKNNCFDKKEIEKEKQILADKIIFAQKKDMHFSDLYAERIVFLYWSGLGDKVEHNWIEKVQNSESKNSGWSINETGIIPNAHTTGLASLAILYYIEGNKEQVFY